MAYVATCRNWLAASDPGLCLGDRDLSRGSLLHYQQVLPRADQGLRRRDSHRRGRDYPDLPLAELCWRRAKSEVVGSP